MESVEEQQLLPAPQMYPVQHVTAQVPALDWRAEAKSAILQPNITSLYKVSS